MILRTFAPFGAGACMLLLLAFVTFAQDAATQTEPTAPPPAVQTPDPNYKPGFIEAFGRWLQEGRAKFDSQMKGAREKFGEFHNKAKENAKEAVGAIAGLPNARAMNGHERCEVAPNGAPDCRNAANTICRGKGFQTGKILDSTSEEKCPARVFLSGRTPAAGECKTETFVTRAVCQ
jgi:hypothetical protein